LNSDYDFVLLSYLIYIRKTIELGKRHKLIVEVKGSIDELPEPSENRQKADFFLITLFFL